MILFTTFATLLILGVEFFHSSVSSECGENIGNCSNNFCCSGHNFCGQTDEHCSADCQPEYGRCNPRRVNPIVGLHVTSGVHCGKYKEGINYCPKGQCCSKYGYCANSTTHCGDDCQLLFGRCNQISSCKLAGRQNFFPTTSYFQRSLKNEDKNYWFPLCEAEQIFFDTRQPLEAVTCSEDGSRPKIKKNCADNAVYKSFVRNSKDSPFHEDDPVVDGNLVTCRDINDLLEIQFSTAVHSIRDIRITLHKTSAASFTLEVLDKPHSSKKKQSVTKILFQTKFNNTIKYGQSVVFFSNVTAPLAAGFKRIIRVTPHIPMKICEIEAASNELSSTGSNFRIWVAVISSVIFGIFFLVTILLVTILCLRSHRLNRKSASSLEKKAIYPTPSPAYNLYTESRMTHPPISESGIDQQYCCDDDQEENPYELYEDLFPMTGSSDQLLSNESREDRESTTEMSDDNYLAPIKLTNLSRPLPLRPDSTK